MVISVLTITCPIDGLTCFVIDLDWQRSDNEDKSLHLHIPVRAQAQCVNGHRWKIHGENGGLILERNGG